MDVKGKIIIVTGGALGIGRALCRRFVNEGAKTVIIADVNEKAASALAGEIGAVALTCDVSREEDVIRLVRFAENNFGAVDIFCSNAGILLVGGLEIANESWQRIWDVNVLSHVYAARAVIPGMIRRGGGAFMITASAAGLLNQIGSTPYAVTKHAAVALAENISIMYGDQGIKVFALCPQAVDTEMKHAGDGLVAGAASVDGLMTPEKLADMVMEGLQKEEFLILPHPEVKAYIQRKASDYDRWLRGMRRLQARLNEGTASGKE